MNERERESEKLNEGERKILAVLGMWFLYEAKILTERFEREKLLFFFFVLFQ